MQLRYIQGLLESTLAKVVDIKNLKLIFGKTPFKNTSEGKDFQN